MRLMYENSSGFENNLPSKVCEQIRRTISWAQYHLFCAKRQMLPTVVIWYFILPDFGDTVYPVLTKLQARGQKCTLIQSSTSTNSLALFALSNNLKLHFSSSTQVKVLLKWVPRKQHTLYVIRNGLQYS